MSDDFEIIFYTELGSCVSEASEATDIGSRVSQAAIKVWDIYCPFSREFCPFGV